MEFIDLKTQYLNLKDQIDTNVHSVLDSGQYMMGNYVRELERELADYVGVKYCVTCGNGTDALQLALMTWNIKQGDAVFLPSFTFYATAEVVSLMGATPIFIDCDENTFNIDCDKLEKAINEVAQEKIYTPKIIIAVDLFGQPADYNKVKKLADKYNLLILEDGAQGFGGSIDKKMACSFGDISTTSFFPAKPLGCYGDGGALFTNSDEYYELLLSYRVHGKGKFKYDNIRVGMNSRLDTMQAAILLPKFNAFKNYELKERNKIAAYYSESLKNIVIIPKVIEKFNSSWAQYTILLKNEKERDFLKYELQLLDIPSMVYYPIPMHKQSVYMDYSFNLNDLKTCENISKICLSIPMHPYLKKEEQDIIINAIKSIIKRLRNE